METILVGKKNGKVLEVQVTTKTSNHSHLMLAREMVNRGSKEVFRLEVSTAGERLL